MFPKDGLLFDLFQVAMDKELDDFRRLLIWIGYSHTKPWEYSGADALAIWSGLQNTYPSCNAPDRLRSILPREESVSANFNRDNAFLYLNPIGDSIVPVCSLSCNFGRFHPSIRFECGLFTKIDGETMGYGYRFEGPEGGGIHNYYHAQFIHRLGNYPFPNELPPAWISDTWPAFAIDAVDGVSLLLSMLVSLYGLPEIERLQRNDPALWNSLDGYWEATRCKKSSGHKTIWYWEVTLLPSARKRPREIRIHVDSLFGEEESRSRLSKLYTGCKLRPITRGAYEANHNAKRIHLA